MQKLLRPLLTAKSKSVYSIFSVVVVTIFSTWAVFDGMKTEVVFAADGEEQTVKTDTDTVGELLDDLDIEVGEHDELSHEENAEIEDGMKIELDSAKEILLTIDGETEEYYTAAKTVGEFFREEGLNFSKHDEISHNNMEILRDNIEIDVEKAFSVVIQEGKEDEEEVWTTGGTVEELLEANDISFKKNDEVKPGLDKKVKEDMEISIAKVKTKTVEEEETIPFETKEEEDSSLEKGKTRTVTEGKDGKIMKTYEVTYKNGEETDRELVEEEVVKDEQDEVVAVGTKEKVKEVATSKSSDKSDSSNSSSSSKSSSASKSSSSSDSEEPSGKSMTMEATAYGPDCAGCSGTSATGMDLTSGPKVIAVDPSVIPLGSKVWVEGYGEAVAGDTGGDIKGNRIDVLMPSESEAASSWGRKTVKVKILD